MVLTILSLILVAVPSGVAAPSTAEEEIRNAEKSWADAVVAVDLEALERIFGDQLIYAHAKPLGRVETKAGYLGRLRTGAQKYTAIERQSMTIRVYGDAAVTHSKVRLKGKGDDRVFDEPLMMLHVWVKQNGVWRLVAHQTTSLQ